MKRINLFCLALLLSIISFGQSDWIFLNNKKTLSPNISILESSDKNIIIRLTTNAYRFEEVITPNGIEQIPILNGHNNILHEGFPSLPIITKGIYIPNNDSVSYEIMYSDFELLSDIKIAPSKGSIYRNVNPKNVPYKYGRAYSTNDFLPKNISYMDAPYIIHNAKGSNIIFHPFIYNAVSKELKIYKEIIVKIKFNNQIDNNKSNNNKTLKNEEFETIFNRLFVNYSDNSKYTPINEGNPGKMLIIANDKYASTLTNFIKWKREKGIETELVLTSTISTSINATKIKTYIQNYYDNNNLTYVLLVGDAADVPSMQINSSEGLCESDNYYTYLSGNDKYADIFIGRFSGNNISEIQTQIDRTLHYEKNLNENDTWLSNAFGSASSEGSGSGHDGGESDLTHINNIKTDLQNYGYTVTHVNEVGGTNAQISSTFNNGVGIANYIGHGDYNMWVNTAYTNSNVSALTNENKLPFIWSVACLNGDFKNNTTCFAEAWLRSTKNGNPTGAIAFLGSTINQSWTEPMTANDEMVDILVDSYSSNIKRTFGGLSFNGMFLMIQEGGLGQEMADTWTIFGDPSLMVRTKTPSEMIISHNPSFSLDEINFEVLCNTDGALVCLTKEIDGSKEIISYDYVSSGIATLNLSPNIIPQTLTLTITAFNKITYQSDVLVTVPSGPYIIHYEYNIDDSEGNNNGFANNGETIKINQSLKNIGVEIANNVSVTVSTSDHNILIENVNVNFGDIKIDSIKTINSSFNLTIPNVISDQTIIPIKLNISDNNTSWESNYNIIVHSPNIKVEFSQLNDLTSGNNNGRIDIGENVKLLFNFSNIGHAPLQNGTANLYTSCEYATIIDNFIETIPLNESENTTFEFEIQFSDDNQMLGSDACFTLALNAGGYNRVLSLCLPIGLLIEDWESNSLDSFNWDNSDTKAWTIVSNEKYQGSYSLKSGTISHNESSSFKIILDVSKNDNIEFYQKVSCEPSESWFGEVNYYDYLAFYIDGNLKGRWAGLKNWTKQTYSITPGIRELKWIYTKDNMYSSGSDCAWIDNIKLPFHSNNVFVTNQENYIDENNINIYPNPASNFINLDINLKESVQTSIKIFNINGQVVYEIEKINLDRGNNTIYVNTNSFINGYYFVEIYTNKYIFHNKIVINK